MASSIEKKNTKSALNNSQSQGDLKLLPGLLVGKVAIITGSSRGIGKGTAGVFINHGAKVIINGRNESVCRFTCQEINQNGGDAISCSADITNKQEVDSMVAAAIDAYGKIDILVNNAGTSSDALIHKMSDDLFRFIIDLNLKGTHLVSQAVINEFRKQKKKERV